MKSRTAKKNVLSPSFIASLSRSLALATLAAAGFAEVQAANLTWDPLLDGDGVIGGAGAWNTTDLFWDPMGTDPVIADNLAWINANNDTAIFGGTGGTVTLGVPITAGGLRFDTAGYIVTGNTLTLAGGGTINTVADATISSIVAGGAGLNKTGAGVLSLSGDNTYGGGTSITAGTVNASFTNGQTPLGSGTIQLSGATLSLTPTANTATAGLSGRQFASTISDTARIDFTQTAASVRTDATINTTGVTAGQAVQWAGKLNITTGGAYTFVASADDGIRLFVDGVLVVQNDGPKGPGIGTSAAITLSAGLHDVRIDYVNSGGGGQASLSYQGPDQAVMGIVPSTALFTAETNTTAGSSNAVVMGAGIGNDLVVSGNSTIALQGSAFTQTQLGNATLSGGSTLNITSTAGQIGKALRFGGTTTFGGNTTLNLAGDGTNGANLYLDGALSDGGSGLTVTKSGNGRLFLGQTAVANNLSSSSTFDVQAGALVVTGSSAAGSFNPLGSAAIKMSGGNVVLDSKIGSLTVPTNYNNNIDVTANGTIQSIVSGGSLTTLSGTINVGAGNTLTLDAIAGGNPVSSLGAFVTLAGDLTGAGNINVISTRVGTLPITPVNGTVFLTGNTSAYTGTMSVGTGATIQSSNTASTSGLNLGLAGGVINLFSDGNGTGTPESIGFNPDLSVSTTGTVAVGRLGNSFAPYFTQAVNKTVQAGSLSAAGTSMTVNNANGYGLDVTGAVTLVNNDQTFIVNTASASNLVQGLTFSGQVTGAFGITKQGAGALSLTNATNSFGAVGELIDIQGGIVAASSDGALGDVANGVRLNVNAATGAGFRATGTFATSRTFTLNQSLNGMEVVSGKTLTLNSALAGTTGTTQLVKNDMGTLELNAANPASWTGSITAAGGTAQTLTGGLLVNQGVVRISNAGALGAANNIIAVNTTSGSAVEIAGGITVPNPLVLNTQTANAYAGGINWGGALRSIGSGVTNTWSGPISENQDSGISADAGNTLNLTGGITFNAHIVVFGGAGNINVTTNPILTVHSLDKIGSGTTNIQVNTAGPTGNGIRVYAGELIFSGTAGGVVGSTAVQTIINPGATLTLDSSTGAFAGNRMNNRAMQFLGGNLNLIGGAAATTEAIGAPTFNRGQTTITVTSGAGGADLTFTAASNNVAPAQTTAGSGATVLFRGTSLGTAAGPGIATIRSTTGGLLFNGQTGATGTNNKAILPWALIDTTTTGLGSSFATGDAAAGAANTTAILRPLSASEYSTAAALTTNANMLISTPLTTQATTTVNSLTIDSGGSVAMNPLQSLTTSSGGILVRNGVTSSISGGILAAPAANSPWSIHTPGTASLAVSSLMTGGNANSNVGLMKAGNGVLILSTPTTSLPSSVLNGMSANTLNMQTVVNQGTLRLNGGTNPLGNNNFLEVGAGGTLDLNGSSQYVLGLFTDGVYNGIAGAVTSGGTVTSSTPATLVVNSDARNWSGQIAGNVFFNRTGTASTTTIFTPQTYTGGTLINGGTVSLRDYGSLANTSGISINFANLTLDNTQASGLSGRVGSVPITMRGGTFVFQGRVQTDSTESIGAVSIAEGWNNLTALTGNSGFNSAVLTVASLSRPASSAGIVNFSQAGGGVASNGQLGSNARLLLTSAPTLSNNIIGAWAINSRDWASYIPDLGQGGLIQPGFAGYAALTASPLATDNIRSTTGFTLAGSGTLNINTMNLNTNANQTVDLAGRTVNLVSGGLMIGLSGDNTTVAVNNGTITSGLNNGAANDLYLYHLPYAGTNRQASIGAVVADNGGTPVRLIVSSSEAVNSAQRTTLNALNTYTGGTVVNQGTLAIGAAGTLPAGGVTLNNGALTQQVPGQATPGTITPSNVVTLNGSSALNFAGPNTINGIVFNNHGGTVTPAVNSFIAGVGSNGTGTLTIGAGGVTASSSNVQTTATLVGRFDFGASNTITVNPITVNGVSVAPLQPALAIQGWIGSGTVTKAGNGVLQLNAQQVFSGTLNVTAGGVSFGALGNTGLAAGNAAGSRFASINLASDTYLNLSNTDSTIGSLAGSGTVTNVAITGLATLRTFNVGFDGTNTTFSGSLARWSDAFPANFQVNKIGGGTMTLTGVNTTTSNLQVSQGGVTFSGAGTGVFGTNLILPTGTITLDNSGSNVSNRLGGATNLGTLTVGGGNFRVIGNAAAPTTETMGTVNIGLSAGNLYGTPTVTLEAHPAQPLTFTVGTTWGGIPIGSSSLIRGISATAGNGQANFNLGTIALGAPTGSGTGANGTTTMAIRPDILGDASASGIGTGFIVKDSVTNFLRPLASSELASVLTTGMNTATVNTGLSSTVNLSGRTTTGSLTLNSGGGLAADPALPTGTPEGLATGLVLNTGGILAFAGNTGINVSRLETTNSAYHFHTHGDLNVNAVLFGTGSGLNKGEQGTLTLNARNLYTGQTQVNAGTLKLNGGDNTLALLVTASAPGTTAIGVNTPTAVIDLNGTNQITGTFGNNQSGRYTGNGGTLTNTSATTSNYTSISGSAQVFGGTITGNLNFNKTGNQPLGLSNVNTFTGTATFRANTLTLIDAGALANTSAINLNYAGLNLDNSGLNPLGNLNPTRVPAAAPVSLRGGTVTLTGGGSIDSAATINTINVLEGHNTLSVPQAPLGGTNKLTIGNLVRAANPDATVNFTGGTGGFFSNNPGLNQSNLYINSIDGVAIPVTIPGKILGGWAVANNGEFVTYISPGTTGSNGQNFGIVTMNGTTGPLGTITQDQYDATTVAVGNNPTQNVRINGTGTQTIAAGNATINVLAVRAALTNLNFTGAADVLNLNSGGLALTNGGTTVGVLGTGRITSGGTLATGIAPLYVYSNGNANTINAIIQNNGAGAQTRLVVTAIANQLNLAGANTYTGGTAINGAGGGVTLTGAAATVVIPAGGLTLNNVTMTMATNAGQIAAANDVTLNGGSTLTLVGSNTLNSLSFNNTGGTANPTVATATNLTLSSVNAITAVNDNASTVPTISGTLLTLPAGANINTSTTANVPTNLVISAPIASAGAINKTGNGSLDLSGNSTFAGGVNLTSGTLMLGLNSTPTTGAVTSGPLGTGPLTISGGTALISDTAIRTVANAVTVNGDFTLGSLSGANGSTVAVNGVILSGPVALGAGVTRTINVNSLLNVSTMSGIVSGAGTSIVKTGAGTLALTGANTFDGGITINGGTLQSGASGLGVTGVVTFAGGVLQHAASTTTDFSSRISTANNQPIFIDTNNQTVTYASPLTSATGGSLGKFGAGTLILTATANYDGPTIISAGTLQVGNGGTTGDLPTNTNIINSGTLLWNRSDADSIAGVISGGGSLTKQGITGRLTLTAANTFTGNVTVSSGELAITNSQALGVGPKTVTVVPTTNPTSLPSLRLDGSGGDIILPASISFTTSYDALNAGVPIANAAAVVNEAGNNTIQGNFSIPTGGGGLAFLTNGGKLTISGNITPTATARTLHLRGDATGEISGVIANGTTVALPVNLDSGNGTWTLSGVNTYTGPTTISTGVLLVNGSISGSATTVNATGTLGGIGTTGAVTVNSGFLAPGNLGVGTLDTGTLSLTGGTMFVEIGGPASYDQVDVTGSITLGGALSGTIVGGYVPTFGQTDLFFIGVNDGLDPITGTFAGLPEGSILSVGGYDFIVGYTGDSVAGTFTGGNDIVLSVPEPGSAALLLGGLCLLAGGRRLRRRD